MDHVYLSTACLHAQHGEEPGHPRCKQNCKYCGNPCICECHSETVPFDEGGVLSGMTHREVWKVGPAERDLSPWQIRIFERLTEVLARAERESTEGETTHG